MHVDELVFDSIVNEYIILIYIIGIEYWLQLLLYIYIHICTIFAIFRIDGVLDFQIKN